MRVVRTTIPSLVARDSLSQSCDEHEAALGCTAAERDIAKTLALMHTSGLGNKVTLDDFAAFFSRNALQVLLAILGSINGFLRISIGSNHCRPKKQRRCNICTRHSFFFSSFRFEVKCLLVSNFELITAHGRIINLFRLYDRWRGTASQYR